MRKLHHIKQDLLDRECYTVTTSEPTDEFIKINEAVHQAGQYRSDNYVVDDNMLAWSVCYTVTYVDNRPALASAAWARPFYEGSVRVLTHYCAHPDFRAATFGRGIDGMRVDVATHADQQIAFCQSKGYEQFFLSKEDKTRQGRNVQLICQSLDRYSEHTWKMSEERRLVAPDRDNSSCWQWILYTDQMPDLDSPI